MVIIEQARKIKNRYLNPNTGVSLYRRLEQFLKTHPKVNELFPFERFQGHYVYEPARQTVDHPDVFINQIRYYRLYEYFSKNYPDIFLPSTKVVDVGDTSGVLFKAMGRRGLSVNINADVVAAIKQSGVDAQIGDIEHLPFEKKMFDYAFCFQCLEHLNNPIQALTELSRITRGKIFVSIPYVTKTKIYDRQHWQDLKKKSFGEGGWNERDVRFVDSHKFEFSASDFKKVVTHADLKCIDHFPINYFQPMGLTKQNSGTYFNFFILEPIS